MKFMPSPTPPFSAARALAGSSGSPHTSLPGRRMAPNPRRRTSRSPSRIVEGTAAKLRSSFMRSNLTPRRHLRALGHHLQPVVHVGKEGLSAALVAAVGSALGTHELIKVRLSEKAEGSRHELSTSL